MKLKLGDRVKVVQIPKDLTDAAKIGTPRVFRNALGKIFRVDGFDDYGFVQLSVSKLDRIFIEPEFLTRLSGKKK